MSKTEQQLFKIDRVQQLIKLQTYIIHTHSCIERDKVSHCKARKLLSQIYYLLRLRVIHILCAIDKRRIYVSIHPTSGVLLEVRN